MADPVGEDSWLSLVDEASRSAEDLVQRVEAVELYKTALFAEPYSLRLWLAYCEWVWSLHTDCQSSDAGWPDEERLLGQEIFSLDTALGIWAQGAQGTKYRLNDSHVLWNRWMMIELEELEKSGDAATIKHIRALFVDRLQIPHANWEDTSQMFSTFITKYDEDAWEATMVRVTTLARPAKELYRKREVHELSLQKAIDSGDTEVVEVAILDYLGWEASHHNKNGKPLLLFALFERALLLCGTNAAIWEDYVVAVNNYEYRLMVQSGKEESNSSDYSDSRDPLRLLERATKHCPSSGSLWSRYMLRAEMQGLSFSYIEQIKHAATGSGQLDRDGMIDVLKVYSAWCGFLRRRAVSKDATDEDTDVADVGLSSALESSQEWGERLYGRKVYKGDPGFRIEQCLIQYLTLKGSADEARTQWVKLARSYGGSYEFWQRYYAWEMTVAAHDSDRSLATAVLKQAVKRGDLDWPEKIIDMYLQHCENYADPETLASAIDLAYVVSKELAKRRQREAMEVNAAYAAQRTQEVEPVVADPAMEESPGGNSKRKRESASDDGTASKKFKSDADEDIRSQHLKRDRENTSVLVTNLPPDVTQTKIRQYFKEYGHINNLAFKRETDGKSSAALVEFRSTEDVQSAMIKDGKFFGDKQIIVRAGTGLTLYVTNYPPTADDAYMYELFSKCGEIFNIRWPSLKYNLHRRFCYISFRTAEAAAAATQLDGKFLEGRYKLEAKYSNPALAKPRHGAGAEGRELHVANIDPAVDEDELRDVFAKYGDIENVRILRNIVGKSKGGGFVVFAKKEDATEALALDKTKLKSRILTVDVSVPNNYKPIATTLGAKATSASPAPSTDGFSPMPNSPAPPPNNHLSSEEERHNPPREEIAKRTITLLNIPDTVNDARIRALIEPYGAFLKLTLRPDHQGAIVEFADVASAGRAALGLENHEIVPGRKLRMGLLKDLFHEKGEIRVDRIQTGPSAGKKKPPMTGGFIPPTAPVRRPGGRGGLGTKRGLGYSAVSISKKAAVPTEQLNRDVKGGTAHGDETRTAKPKSNADFKALFAKGTEK